MMKRTMRVLLMASLTLALSAVSWADTVTARMDVMATVVVNCRLVVQPLSFGNYDPLATNATQPVDTTSTLTVTCTRNTNAALSFDLGLSPAGTSQRSMKGPGLETLQYQIYRDSSYSQIWGTGGNSKQLLSRGVTQPEQFTVFGRIPPQQEVEPGSYTDVLTAAVDF